jgi:hypothetical protein
MRARSVAATAGVVVALSVFAAVPASAAAPARGCPSPFTLLTFKQQVALAMDRLDLTRQEAIDQAVQPTLDLIDRNGDRLLCYSFPTAEGPPNVIDNTASSTG